MLIKVFHVYSSPIPVSVQWLPSWALSQFVVFSTHPACMCRWIHNRRRTALCTSMLSFYNGVLSPPRPLFQRAQKTALVQCGNSIMKHHAHNGTAMRTSTRNPFPLRDTHRIQIVPTILIQTSYTQIHLTHVICVFQSLTAWRSLAGGK